MRKLLPCSIVEKIWYHPPTADVTVAFSIFLTFASRFTSVQFELYREPETVYLTKTGATGLSKIKKTILEVELLPLEY